MTEMTLGEGGAPSNTLGMLIETMKQVNITNQNLNNTIEGLRQEMKNEYVRKDVLEPQLTDIKDDIKKHAGYWDWLVKIVAAIVIAALLSVVIIQGGH